LKIETFDIRSFPGGGYIIIGAALCGGKSLAILKTFFKETVKMFCGKSQVETDYYQIMNSINYQMIDKEKFLHVETLFDGTRINEKLY